MKEILSNSKGQALAEYSLVVGILCLFVLGAGSWIAVAFSEYIRAISFVLHLPIP